MALVLSAGTTYLNPDGQEKRILDQRTYGNFPHLTESRNLIRAEMLKRFGGVESLWPCDSRHSRTARHPQGRLPIAAYPVGHVGPAGGVLKPRPPLAILQRLPMTRFSRLNDGVCFVRGYSDRAAASWGCGLVCSCWRLRRRRFRSPIPSCPAGRTRGLPSKTVITTSPTRAARMSDCGRDES